FRFRPQDLAAMTELDVRELRPVEVRGLVKQYGRLTAVDQVDLTVESGDVYGFLGPNGAGKTTTLRMLLGLIRRDAGSIRLFGRASGSWTNPPTASIRPESAFCARFFAGSPTRG